MVKSFNFIANFKTLFLSLILFCFSLNFNAQNRASGKIVNAETQEALAFANVTVNGNKNKGVISDINGNFLIYNKSNINSLEVSYLGFEPQKIEVNNFENLIIELVPTVESLSEVVITNGENPALKIIRKVIANRDINNPLKKGGFKYISYNKSIVDSESRQLEADSLRNIYLSESDAEKANLKKDSLNDYEKTLIKEGNFNIMLLESVTERKFLPPNLSEERVIGNRVSGFKNAYFAMLATEIQPFGFYENTIDLLDLHLLNPIAKGSLKRYDYFLEDEIVRDNDTIYNISFQPKKNANIDGLKGFLNINSNGYAIQTVVAEPADELMIFLKITQNYQKVNGNWFPEQLNFEMKFSEDIYIIGKTYLQDIEFLDNLRPRDFSEVQLKFEKTATEQDEDFWNKYRKDSLTQTDITTYKVVDSIGRKMKLDKLVKVGTSIANGFIPLGKFNIPLNRFFDYNRFEGFRLGAGIETSEKLFSNLILGGYTAYGFKDENFKFGGKVRYNFNDTKEFFAQFNYKNDVREIGTSTLENSKLDLNRYRDFIAFNMDIIEQFQFKIGRRDFKNLTWDVGLRTEWVRPQYNYIFADDNNFITNYRNTAAVLNLRYAHRERIVETPNSRVSLGTDYPIFNARFVQGFDSFLNGDYSYQKLEASLYQSFYSKNLGKTRYHLQAGYIDGNLPLGLLFTGEGSNDEDIPVVMYDTFQTMLPYEFLSDQYVNLFLTHDLGSLIFKSKNFQPGLILHQNVGWGDLANPTSHGFNFKVKNQFFIESGIEITEILKMNYLDIAKIGFGIGGFYRYGFYRFEDNSDNFVLKFNVSFNLKK